MTHLTDDQLNEVLDAGTQVHTYTGTHVLDTSTLRHLDTCADCQSRLEELRVVFTAIESLPEVESPDLTASVMAKLPVPSWGGMASRPVTSGLPIRSTKTWTWLSLAQAVTALTILTWLSSSFILPPEIASYQPPTFDALLTSILTMLSSFTFEIQTSSFIFHPSSFDLQSTTILMFIISAAVLWLVGNGLLLRSPLRGSRK